MSESGILEEMSRSVQRMLLVAALIVCGVGVLVAATDDDDEVVRTERDLGLRRGEYVDAFAAFAIEGDEPLQVSEDEARCVGEAIVDVVGVDRLSSLGVTAADISGPEMGFYELLGPDLAASSAVQIVDRWGECFDLAAVFAATMLHGVGASPEEIACFETEIEARGLVRSTYESAFVMRMHEQLTGDLRTQLEEAVKVCMN